MVSAEKRELGARRRSMTQGVSDCRAQGNALLGTQVSEPIPGAETFDRDDEVITIVRLVLFGVKSPEVSSSSW